MQANTYFTIYNKQTGAFVRDGYCHFSSLTRLITLETNNGNEVEAESL